MATIYRISARGPWLEAQRTGTYTDASLTTEGCLHCSTATHVARVADALFTDERDLVLLHIDLDKVGAEVRWTEADDAEYSFPHVHGPIELEAILKVEEFAPGADGMFHFEGGDE